jgi:hypothetical protein
MNIVWLCVGVFFLGLSCGLWIERRRWLKNEREGVYSEPEVVKPCVGKGRQAEALRDQINKAVDATLNGWTMKHKPIKWGQDLPDATSEDIMKLHSEVRERLKGKEVKFSQRVLRLADMACKPEGVEPCVGKGEHVMDAYGLGMGMHPAERRVRREGVDMQIHAKLIEQMDKLPQAWASERKKCQP